VPESKSVKAYGESNKKLIPNVNFKAGSQQTKVNNSFEYTSPSKYSCGSMKDANKRYAPENGIT